MAHGTPHTDDLPFVTSREVAHALAKHIQTAIPLEADPWSPLASAVGAPRSEVLAQLHAWDASGHLREISAVLEGSTLGWDSALCAGSVPPEDLDRVAAVVSACPTVTHNYERAHALNLWFTLAMPPEIGVDRALQALEREARLSGFAALRRTETFKIGVRFDLEALENTTTAVDLSSAASGGPAPEQRMTHDQRRMLGALQERLAYEERPFAALAARAGTSEEQLLSFARRHLGGVVRRYVATFRHRKLGVRGNGMVVWRLPEERLGEVGRALAAAPEVSHCYARTTLPGFPYSLYSMIHARDEQAVRDIAARLGAEVGVTDFAILFSTREHKKVRLRYFTPELEAWCSARELGS